MNHTHHNLPYRLNVDHVLFAVCGVEDPLRDRFGRGGEQGRRLMFAVMWVSTKPGNTVITCTPLLAMRLCIPDRNAVHPAFADP